jgi:hypothetical protein
VDDAVVVGYETINLPEINLPSALTALKGGMKSNSGPLLPPHPQIKR